MATSKIGEARTVAGRLLHEAGSNCAWAMCTTSEDERNIILECPGCKARAQVSKTAADQLWERATA